VLFILSNLSNLNFLEGNNFFFGDFISFKSISFIISFVKSSAKELISFMNMCLQRPQKIRPLCDELLFSEFICGEPEYFKKLTLDNYKNEKYPEGDYLNNDGKITMNIDDCRMINGLFDS
jgi:hypothetical protein